MKNKPSVLQFLLALAWVFLGITGAWAQNVNKVEYFFDSDPGFGLGTDVPVTASPDIPALNFSPSIAALSNGFHTLFVRSRDDSGRWSLTTRWLFIKEVAPNLVNVTKLEYYIDTDPGFGLGTNVPITPGTDVANVAIPIDITALANGFHRVYLRSQDANGRWSETNQWLFIKEAAPTLVNVTKLEYYVDTDPGFGLATNVPITAGTDVSNVVIPVDISLLANGFHRVCLRSQDASGRWSLTNNWLFVKEAAPVLVDVVKMEYFVDNDPGFGLGINVPITPGTNVANVLIPVDITAMSLGFHYFYVRTQDANGRWSLTNRWLFVKETPPTLVNVTKMEYFVDADPGFGLGIDVPITPGTDIANVTIPVDITALSFGFHYFYVRTQDANGRWSITNRWLFVKEESPVLADVVQVEYFIDTDPGFGLGTPVPGVTPGTNIANLAFAVDISALPIGNHQLYVRSKDANGKWSLTYKHNFSGGGYPNRPGSGVALEFDGTNDYVDMGNNFDSNNFTFECWLKRDRINAGAFSDRIFVSNNNFGWAVYLTSDNRLNLGYVGVDAVQSTGTVADLNWHHIAVSYNGSTATFYIDGVPSGSVAYVRNFNSGNGNYSLGSRAASEYFDGRMDEVRVWNTALSQSNLRDWMCKKLTNVHPDYVNLSAYYRCDEGSNTTLLDLANSHVGTLMNGTAWVNSGAALGDISAYTYGGANVTLTDVDQFAVSDITGSPSCVHVYKVREQPNSIVAPGGVTVETSRYFGVFKSGGTNPTYDAVYNYTNNGNVNGNPSESVATLLKRDYNADLSWDFATGPLNTNTNLNTIAVNNDNGVEYIVGFGGAYVPRPGSGYALQFSGTQGNGGSGNDAGNIGTVSTFNYIHQTGVFSLEAWVKPDNLNPADQVIVCNSSTTAQTGFYFGLNTAAGARNVYFQIYRGVGGTFVINTSTANGTFPNDNGWHHVAVTGNGTNVTFYIDGVAYAGAGTMSGFALTDANNTVGIGGKTVGAFRNQFNGQIDEVSFWRAPLTQTQVRDWMCKKMNLVHPAFGQLHAYYRFDDGVGNSLLDLVGGLNATLANSPAWVLSGAAIGDESAYTYGGTNVTLTHPNGDSFTSTITGGNPFGMQVYMVNEAPNVVTPPVNFQLLDNLRYWGTFAAVNGGPTTHTAQYNYNGHPYFAPEDRLQLAVRDDNSDATWADLVGTVDINANTITKTGLTGTEYILGHSNDCNTFPSFNLLPGNNVNVCDNAFITLYPDQVFSSYAWSNGATTSTINVNTAGNYTLTVTNPSGCTASAVSVVSVVASPVGVSITPDGPTTFCVGGSVGLSAPAGYTTYQWNTGATTQNITAVAAGTYILQVTNANNCAATASINVSNYPSVFANVTAPPAVCAGAPAVISATGADFYLWSTGATTSSITVNAGGNYGLTASNTFGCSATATVSLLDRPNPTVTISGPSFLCTGSTATLTATGTNINSLLWSNGVWWTNSIGINAPGTYSISVNDGYGCTAEDSHPVGGGVAPPVAITPGGPTTFCLGGSVQLTASPGYANYSWNTGETTQIITASLSGNYIVQAWDTLICVGTANQVVTVVAPPSIFINGDLTVCAGNSGTLVASVPGGATYLWSDGNTTDTFTWNVAGTYSVTATNPTGCTSSVSFNTTVSGYPTASISGPTSICVGEVGFLTADGGVGGPFGYAWSTGFNGNPLAVNASGTYTVTVYNGAGCAATASATVNTVATLPVSITPAGNTEICPGGSVVFTATAGYGSYLWNNGATTESITATLGGAYTVSVTNGGQCGGTATPVTVSYRNLINDFTASQNLLFIPPASPVGFTPNVTAPIASYEWDFGDGGTSNLATPTHSYGTAGNFTVRLIVEDLTGCRDTLTKFNYIVVWPVFPTTQLVTGTTQVITSVSFASGTNGCFTLLGNGGGGGGGGGGQVCVTNNGGLTWFPAGQILGGSTVNNIFLTGGAGFIFGSNGLICVSYNNGASWVPFTTGTSETFYSGWFSSPSYGFSVGSNGTICFYNGTNWIPYNTGVSNTFYSVYGYGNYAWAVGSGGIICRYFNGTWVPQNSGVNVDLTSVYFVNANVGWCTGANGTILYTTNGGLTWVQIGGINPTWNLNSITAYGNTVLCVGNYGVVYYSVNAGANWQLYSIGDTLDLTSCTIVDCVGYITGVDGRAFRFTIPGCGNVGGVNACVPGVAIAPSGPTNFCAGGSVVLTASNGFDQYSWSNGATTQSITVTSTGSYVVTTTGDGGCTSTASLTVNVAPLTPTISAYGNPDICQGESVLLVAESGYATYNWSTGETLQAIVVSTPGAYTVSVGSGVGCTGTSAPYAINYRNLINDFAAANTVMFIPPGATTSFSANVSPSVDSFWWDFGDGGTATGPTPSHTYANEGNYNVQLVVMDSTGCRDTLLKPAYIQVWRVFPTTTLVTGTTQVITGVSFINGYTGCISLYGGGPTGGGQVCVTTDSGNVWLPAGPLNTTSSVSNIFLIGNAGWIFGSNGLICVSYNGGLTWNPFVTNTSETFYNGWFGNANYGWAVGSNGTICQYNGVTWVPYNTGVSNTFYNVYGYGNYAWAVGSGGIICRYFNGTWVPQNSGTVANLQSVYFISELIGWCVGEGGLILHTIDGGITWTQVSGGLPWTLYSISSDGQGNCLAVGQYGVVCYSTNGGLNWSLYSIGDTLDLTACTINNCVGYITGVDGRAYRFIIPGCVPDIDGECNQLLAVTPAAPTLCGGTVSLEASSGFDSYLWNTGDTTSIIVVGVTGTYSVTATGIGGCTATATASVTPPNLITDFAAASTVLFIPPGATTTFSATVAPSVDSLWWDFGDGDADTSATPSHTYLNEGFYTVTLVVQDENGCRDTLIKPAYIQVWRVFPTTTLVTGTTQVITGVSFINGYTGCISLYGGGPTGGGQVCVTTDSGNVWLPAGPLNTTSSVSNIFLIGNAGWIFGSNGLICVSYNGGLTWNPFVTNTSETFYNGWFGNANYGWAVGSNGTICQYNGVTWIPYNTGVSNTFYNVYGYGNYAWAVGSGGIICRYFNGTWVPQNSGTVANLQSVYFISELIGWCVGEGGLILHTIDGGITWTQVSGGLPWTLYSVTSDGQGNCLAVGQYGVVCYSTNGGLNWELYNIGDTLDLTACTINNCVGYITGVDGRAYRFIVPGCVITNCGCACNQSIGISPTAPTVCGGSTTLEATAGFDTYLWSNGETTSSITVNAVGTYSVTATGAQQCSATASVVVTPPDLITDFTASNTLIFLPPGPGDVTFTPTVSGSIASYDWDFGDGATDSVETPSHTYTQPGFYTVSLVVTDSSGCSDSLTKVQYIQVWQVFPTTTQTTNTTQTVTGVSFINAYTGCISLIGGGPTGGGQVCVTTDSGNVWLPAGPLNTTSSVSNIFLYGNAGWIFGSNGLICVSYNGGLTWNPFVTGTSATFYSGWFGAANYGWAVGSNGTICQYNGVNWLPYNTGVSNTFYNVYGYGNYVWAVGSGGIICRYFNGTWVPQNSGTAVNLHSVYFISELIGWCVGEGGLILHTIDGGITWTQVSGGLPWTLYSVTSDGQGNCLAVGQNGVVCWSTNGGLNWQLYSIGDTLDLHACTINNCVGYITGVNGRVFRFIVPGCIPSPEPCANAVSISGDASICLGETTTLTASAGYTSYAWSDGATTASITTNLAGLYSVTATGAGGCTTSASISVSVFDPVPVANVIYVNDNATGLNNGTSWANAYTSLQTALAAATAGKQIWVAEGTYKPTTGTSRSVFFGLKAGVSLYGGYPDDYCINTRDWVLYPTILSGNIGDTAIATDNSYRVVAATNIGDNVTLDGFIIRDAYSNTSGGGMTVTANGVGRTSSPLVQSCLFVDNFAKTKGGGAYIYALSSGAANPTFNRVRFYNNTSQTDGGGLATVSQTNGSIDIEIDSVQFDSNSTIGKGGGICNWVNGDGFTQMTVTASTFTGNTATANGGAIYNYSRYASTCSFNADNCTFTGNSGENGGAMFSHAMGATVQTVVSNSLFENNTANRSGGAVCSYNELVGGTGSHVLESCTLTNNTAFEGGGFAQTGLKNAVANTTISACSISANNATQGGAIFQSGTLAAVIGIDVVNSLLFNHSVLNSGGALQQSAGSGASSTTNFVNSVVHGNTAPVTGQAIRNSVAATGGTAVVNGLNTAFTSNGAGAIKTFQLNLTAAMNLSYCLVDQADCPSMVAGTGTITCGAGMIYNGNPQYVSPGSDFHLTAGSPCIDAGTSNGAPATDYDGLGRPAGAGHDIGAYEYGGAPLRLASESNSQFSILNSPLKIYPNPTFGELNVVLPPDQAGDAFVQVFDARGSLVAQTAPGTDGIAHLDLGGQVAGVYLLRIRLNGQVLTERVMLTN